MPGGLWDSVELRCSDQNLPQDCLVIPVAGSEQTHSSQPPHASPTLHNLTAPAIIEGGSHLDNPPHPNSLDLGPMFDLDGSRRVGAEYQVLCAVIGTYAHEVVPVRRLLYG